MSQGCPGEIILDLGGPSSNDKCLYKMRGGERTHRGPGHMKAEAATGMMLTQAQESLEPQEAGRGRKKSPLEPWEIAWTCRHINFQTLAPRARREYISLF